MMSPGLSLPVLLRPQTGPSLELKGYQAHPALLTEFSKSSARKPAAGRRPLIADRGPEISNQ